MDLASALVFTIEGIAVCWSETDVYYFSLRNASAAEKDAMCVFTEQFAFFFLFC
jgi:hypothetical protein